jgi:hypothetical protein
VRHPVHFCFYSKIFLRSVTLGRKWRPLGTCRIKFALEKLVIRSNTLSSYAFWINPIVDACNVLKPDWNTSNGLEDVWKGYFHEYSSCCDSTMYWINSSIESEYFSFLSSEPYLYLNKKCLLLGIDGENGFELHRNGDFFVEFCEFPHVGAICKKKPDILATSVNRIEKRTNFNSSSLIIPKIIDVDATTYSSTYQSTINTQCENL